MKRLGDKVSRIALIGAALAGIGLAAAIPAIGQEAPESLLPPGFGDPVPATPPPATGPRPTTPTPSPTSTPTVQTLPGQPLVSGAEGTEAEGEGEEELLQPSLPPEPIRPLENVGPLLDIDGGMGNGAFGGTDGQLLSRLMRRLDAPLPSRWASMLLRRTLLSSVPTPHGVSAPDWIAERAWLLLRMGEADSARLLVQVPDASQYSPKLFEVAMQTSLALADPAGLCPLVEPASSVSRETGWILARAMCAALAGEPGTATAAIEQTRRTRLAGRNTIDLLLAEKVVGAGINGRRSITIEWDGVDQLTAWRYGLASATAVDIPATLFRTVGPQVMGWRARAPMLADPERIAVGRRAAVLGVLSSAALVDLYGGVLDRTDPSEQSGTPPLKLRDAYAAADQADRLSAMRGLWEEGESRNDHYAGLILTARAAARVAPSADYLTDSPQLLRAMFTAGLDRRAARWAGVVESGGEDESWALLALGLPGTRGLTVNASRASSYAGSVDELKGQFLVAGLAGLGRLELAEAKGLAIDLEFELDRASRWSQLLDRAAASGQKGTTVLLAAIGMQTNDWRYVPPAHLYHIISALRRVGLEPEARMIAVEALSRS
jgi:hypothetical protein